MRGLMMEDELCVSLIARRAEQVFGDREIVSATTDGVERSTYTEVVDRACRLAGALRELGVRPGDRVATFAWNSVRHLELYLAVPSLGAVLHTLNIRLFEEDLQYIVGHAEPRVVFLDASLAGVMPRFKDVKHEVLMPDGPGEREGSIAYEELISGAERIELSDVDERSAATLCYTSGTTGKPKGVLTSHRSTVLHALGICHPDAVGLRESDTVMPVVPMFHAGAWGYPYGSALSGSRQVFPGPRMSPTELADQISKERVTKAAGVPTVWQGVLALEDPPDLSSLQELLIGGSAVPSRLARGLEERFGVDVIQGWGMTEVSPVGAVSRMPGDVALTDDERYELISCQGRALSLVRFRLDPERGGELQVRGPWVASSYYDAEVQDDCFTPDGWLRTGDVAEFRRGSYLNIVDRAKDLIKSGGEWISSVELEDAIMSHPDVAEVAVVGVADERWGERPLACIAMRRGELDARALAQHLDGRVASWWIPDLVVRLDEIPKTSVGKHDKKALRARFAAGLPGAAGS